MWEIKIIQCMDKMGYNVFVFADQGGKRVILDGDGITTKDYVMGEDVKPTFFLPQDLTKPLADALAEMGVKTDSDAKLTGTVEATRYHLEDLRKMLKLKK